MRATYVHTNLIAEDWQNLADFYTRVFGCTPVPPERDYSGPDLDRGTGLTKTRLRRAGPHPGDLQLQRSGSRFPEKGQPPWFWAHRLCGG
jgi:hypothetical protein